jgi:hypothetical protein
MGYAAITRSPDGQHLSAELLPGSRPKHRRGWFGERCSSDVIAEGTPAGPAALFARAKRLSLYGLAFDGNDRLIEDLSNPTLDVVTALSVIITEVRVVAHELRHDTPEQNRQHAGARLQAIRAAPRSGGEPCSNRLCQRGKRRRRHPPPLFAPAIPPQPRRPHFWDIIRAL